MFISKKAPLIAGFTLALFSTTPDVWAQSSADAVDQYLTKFFHDELHPSLETFDVRGGLIEQAEYLRSLTVTPILTSLTVNTTTFEQSFGVPLNIGQSGYTAIPSMPGILFGVNGPTVVGATTLNDFAMTPLNLSSRPELSVFPVGAVQSYVFTGRIGSMPLSIGILTRVDMHLLGLSMAQGPGDWRVDSIMPRAWLDESLIDATTARNFVAQSVDGGFDGFGGVAGWLEVAAFAGGNSAAGGSGGLEDCLRDVALAMQQKVDFAWNVYRAQALPLENMLDTGDPWTEAAVGAGLGAAGGAGVGSAAGPIGAVAGAAAGALYGFSAGLLTWAFSGPSATQISQAEASLNFLKNQYHQARCAAVNEAKDRIVDCFEMYDPDNAATAAELAKIWAASEGC